MKKGLKVILASLLAASALTVCASADFAKTKTYTDGMFSDVPASEWYASSVQDAYELGIMQGDSATTFSPDGTLTVAEGVTIAARINETLTGKTIGEAEGEWYQKYVNYAIENGFLKDGRYEDYERTIKRSDMAELLAGVCGELPEINTVASLPDVGEGSSYGKAVYKLYRAGILTGNDAYGTFAPDSKLLRSEISAMAVRIALADKRVAKTFEPSNVRILSDSYYLIDMMDQYGPTGLANGWDYDNRFDLYNRSGSFDNTLTDVDDTQHMALIRKFDTERDGLLHLEMYFSAASKNGGAYLAFEDDDENKLVQIVEKNGKWAFVGASEVVTEFELDTAVASEFRAVMDVDLDNRTAHLVLNNTDCGSVTVKNGDFSRLVLGTNKIGTGSVTLYSANLSKNYVLNEHFIAEGDGSAPAMWDITGDWKLVSSWCDRGYDLTSVKSNTEGGSVSSAKRAFTAIGGKLSMETMILLPEKTDGASVSFTSNGTSVVTFETRDGKIYVGDNMVNDYIADVWQTLHVEADTDAHTADIYVNGKKKATVAIDATYFDGITVSFAPETDAVMWFDDVQICTVIEHDDYPSYPQVAESKDYNIGVNCCWLWRDQHSGEGWDAVSSFEEFEPYIGYYDEGLRETADWELKWLAEHGVDFIHACWYCPQNTVKEPIKKMRHSYYALHEGYMMAKYSDLVDFCIMWENSGQNSTSFEQFRDYIWNYWVEYYFSDPRYARLDNKAVLSVWSMDNFKKAFGDTSCADAVKFMNDELKKLGYDGLILLASAQDTVSAGTYSAMQSLGYDSTYAYSWGAKGYSAEHQIDRNRATLANAHEVGMHHIPTVSIGFNDVGRNYSRDPIITPEDHLKVCEDIKAQLAEMNTGTWMDNTLIVSTMNEYSEGTYFLPTESTGYAYLENIRKTFTDDTSDHTNIDVRATEEQKERVTHLYPKHRSTIRHHQNEASDSVDTSAGDTSKELVGVRTYDMSDAESASAWKVGFGIDNFTVSDGVIAGVGKDDEFAIVPVKWEAIESEKIPFLHIRMKNSEAASFKVFFTTSESTDFDAYKCKKLRITETNEFVDYYINMSANALWSGLVTDIRIVPQTEAGAFEISNIDFMDYATVGSVPAVNVNGVDLTFTFRIKELDNGDYEVVGQRDEERGFYSLMRFYFEWNRDAGELLLKTYNDTTILYTVGSDKALVNGKERELGYTFTLRDGLPVFRIKQLCDFAGYKYTMNGKVVMVQAATDEEYAEIANRKPNQWEFNALEGWTKQNSSISIQDGYLHIVPTNGDPAVMHDVSFKATDYDRLTIGVKYNEALKTAGTPQFFFRTVSRNSFSADKLINGAYDFEGKKEGDIVEVTFELSVNSLYSGTISGVRFDPCTRYVESIDIDYIRFWKTEESATSNKLLFTDDENQWDFENASDSLGWIKQNSTTLEIKDGCLTATGTNWDPGIHRSVDFNADDYQVCVIGVPYKEGLEKKSAEFFFVTKQSPNWEATKGLRLDYEVPAMTAEGEIIELRFDLSTNAKWVGDVTNIRFDPHGAAEEYQIAYVRFCKIDGYVAPEREEPKLPDPVKATKPTQVTLEDPEKLPDGIKVEASRADLSVTADPDNENGKVFEVKANAVGEWAYTYFNLYMQFEAGKTYKVSYAIYPTQTVNGKKFSDTIIGGNFRYSTTEDPNMKDHSFAAEKDRSSGKGWIKVEAEVTVPETYSATDNDCFQLWGMPVGEESVGYLVKDVSITLKD